MRTVPNTAPLAVSVPEAARLLGVSIPTIYRLLRAGRLEKVALGIKRTLITIVSINRLLGPETA
jgi:excisionase family DNA binding protein